MATIFTHNGTFTVKSNKTGVHRTFQVRTQQDDAKFAPGKRILSLLTGPDNSNSFTGFAFVDEFGIHIWKKKLTPTYEAYAKMLEVLSKHEEEGRVTVHKETKCRVCNRKLTTPESILSGIGPVCEERVPMLQASNDMDDDTDDKQLEDEAARSAYMDSFRHAYSDRYTAA